MFLSHTRCSSSDCQRSPSKRSALSSIYSLEAIRCAVDAGATAPRVIRSGKGDMALSDAIGLTAISRRARRFPVRVVILGKRGIDRLWLASPPNWLARCILYHYSRTTSPMHSTGLQARTLEESMREKDSRSGRRDWADDFDISTLGVFDPRTYLSKPLGGVIVLTEMQCD